MALYTQCKGARLSAYEVIKVQYRKERRLPEGRIMEEGDYYPRSEQWGEAGWSFKTREEADAKMTELTPKRPGTELPAMGSGARIDDNSGRSLLMASHHLVINCSAPCYNLGAQKCAAWLRSQGDAVQYADGDPGLFGGQPTHVWLSVIFSWHAPLAADLAWRYKPYADVACGGPGMFTLGHWWQAQTGLVCHRGLDTRFEQQPGDYRMVFASRGCPVGCSFCLVPRLEGTTFTLNWAFQPASVLCDNNLSALPVDFQEHIIQRYRTTGIRLQDANSGFEPRTFDADTYHRWKSLLRGPWRFAYDTTDEGTAVERMMAILAPESPRKKQVYVLIGNESPEACHARCQQVLAWGGEPYVQPLLPLNALSRYAYKLAHGWTAQALRDTARYYNRHLWRAIPFSAYCPRRNGARSHRRSGGQVRARRKAVACAD